MVQHALIGQVVGPAGRAEWQNALERISHAEAGDNVVGRLYSGAVRACGSQNWQVSIQLLCRLWSQSVCADRRSLVVSHGAIISALATSQRWKCSLCLSRALLQACLQTNAVIYNASISAREKGGRWFHSLLLLQHMAHAMLLADVISCSAVISACEKRAQWPNALQLLEIIRFTTLQPNTISCSTALSACAKAGCWQQTLLSKMRWSWIQASTITYNSLVTSCDVGQAWQQSLCVWGDMRKKQLHESVVTHGAVCSVMGRGMKWPQVLRFLQGLKRAKALNNRVAQTSALSACCGRGQWHLAFVMLSVLQTSRVRISIEVYNLYVTVSGRQSLWRSGALILSEMPSGSLVKDSVCCNALMDGFEKSGNWQRATELFGTLLPASLLPDAFTCTSSISACGKATSWAMSLLLLEQVNLQSLQTNAILYNALLTACERGLRWERALQTLGLFQDARLQTSLHAFDAAMLACQYGGCTGRAMQLLRSSRDTRSPISFLWCLATLGSSDPSEILAACKEAIASAFHAEDLPYLLWSCAMLGATSPYLGRLVSERRLLRFLPFLDMSELSMVVYGAAIVSAEVEFLCAVQDSVQACLQSGPQSLDRLTFNAGGQELLGMLFACKLGGALQAQFRATLAYILRAVGLNLDAYSLACRSEVDLPSTSIPAQKNPEIMLEMLDRAVLEKPEGWEVYGGHVKLQLLGFVRGMFGCAPIFQDPDHNHGFLHRLDVPSSGLILVAKTYEAFYDLQVQLHAGDVTRDYTVLCHGWLPQLARCIRASTVCLADVPTVAGGRGRKSVTDIVLCKHFRTAACTFSHMVLSIATGRKHQIRSHLAHVGHATVRDKIYASLQTFRDDAALCMRNWLHRFQISFTDTEGLVHNVRSELPVDLKESLAHLSLKRSQLCHVCYVLLTFLPCLSRPACMSD